MRVLEVPLGLELSRIFRVQDLRNVTAASGVHYVYSRVSSDFDDGVFSNSFTETDTYWQGFIAASVTAWRQFAVGAQVSRALEEDADTTVGFWMGHIFPFR